MNTSIVPGSLSAIATTQRKSIAETFAACDVIIVVDTSGSMSMNDSRGGQSRYDVACQELAQLQRGLPGKIAVIAFSDRVQFCPGGLPVFFGGGTDMAAALKFARVADVPGMRFILISDGEPNDREAALAEARKFKGHVDTIYVGPEDRPSGREFLQLLASVTGASSLTIDRARELASGITHLLASGS